MVMFTDYLYKEIAGNLDIDTFLFSEVDQEQIEEAKEYISEQTPIVDDSIGAIIARYFFAKTLQGLLENSESNLSIYLFDKNSLRNSLRELYATNMNIVNKYFGHKRVHMPGPFIIKSVYDRFGKKDEKIAKGAYGIIYKTTDNYAVKEFITKELEASTLLEISILRYLDHPNVINLLGMQFGPPILMAMPLALGTLKDQLMNTILARQAVFYQILRGLAYCHSRYVWHLDIKPENVLVFQALVSGEMIIKLADFGLSGVYTRHSEKRTLQVISLEWRPPEILLGDEYYTESADVWSVGVMLLDIITGKTLNGKDEIDQLHKIFVIMGSPTKDSWPGVEKLPEWTVNFSGIPYTLDTIIKEKGVWRNESNEHEFKLLNGLLAWPNKRISALDALQDKYFDPVRDNIEALLPALPIEIQNCGEMMLQEQVTLEKHGDIEKERRTMFMDMYVVNSLLKQMIRTLFSAYLLFDVYMGKSATEEISSEKMRKIAAVALVVAADIYEKILPHPDDIVFLFGGNFTANELEESKKDLIEKLDFNLVMPTCDDFIFDYLDGNEHYMSVNSVALALVFNYDYVTTYTQAQLAQIAIEASEIKPACLKGHSRLITDDISMYMEDFGLPLGSGSESEPGMVKNAEYKLRSFYPLIGSQVIYVDTLDKI